jgi:tRNA 2-thiouridine synthesizing protein A
MILDTKGLRCPLPVLRARRALKDVAGGETLTVLATDPGAVKDFEAFCEAAGCDLLGWREDAGVFTFEIRKPA